MTVPHAPVAELTEPAPASPWPGTTREMRAPASLTGR
jgi:hypothetical protein